jgi:AraC family transcriptional regulator
MLLWMQGKLHRYRLDIDGQLTSENRPSALGIFLVPAYAPVEAEFEIHGQVGLTLIFFNDASSVGPLRQCLEQPLSGLTSADLKSALAALSREALLHDSLFDMVSENWITQVLAYLSRVSDSSPIPDKYRGGLTAANMRRVEEYIRSHLVEPTRVVDLAEVVGLSPRHFMRAFRQSFQETPIQFILNLRVEEAKGRLASTGEPITEIALACGFGDAQQFSTTFRKLVGASPSEYRRTFRN